MLSGDLPGVVFFVFVFPSFSVLLCQNPSWLFVDWVLDFLRLHLGSDCNIPGAVPGRKTIDGFNFAYEMDTETDVPFSCRENDKRIVARLSQRCSKAIGVPSENPKSETYSRWMTTHWARKRTRRGTGNRVSNRTTRFERDRLIIIFDLIRNFDCCLLFVLTETMRFRRDTWPP